MRSRWTSGLGLIACLVVGADPALAADPPCDKYPVMKQLQCTEIWKELNKEDGPLIARFGLDQQKRREEGKISAQQHLAENMTFIKDATEKRIKRLKDRMEKD